MRFLRALMAVCGVLLMQISHAQTITVAAAADLKFAMDAIIGQFTTLYPDTKIDVVYGSSGNFYAQIRQGAPYDMYFSADISFPRELAQQGLAASEVRPYAVGRIVLWSATLDASKMTLASLTDPKITRIAIANPKHAPYGERAKQALRAAGVWNEIEPKLVYGENIAHTAQFVQTGNAQIGIIALSLAMSPELSSKGGYWLIPSALHEPLEQGFIITRRAANNALAKRFSDYILANEARAIMMKYGFVLPGE